MEKIDVAERVVSLRKTVIKNEKKDLKNPNIRFCPFSSKREACSSRCKLFRASRHGYECPFQEIPSMSWNLKVLIKKIIGGREVK